MSSSYKRIGGQIAHFLNQELIIPIELPKQIGLTVNTENVQMPTESIQKLDTFIRSKLTTLRAKPPTTTVLQQLSKCYGKLSHYNTR